MNLKRTMIAVFLLCCATVLSLTTSCGEKKAPLQTQQLGTEPVVIRKAAGKVGVLLEWARKGYRGMSLIHVGEHDALSPLSEKTVKELGRHLHSKDWDALEKKLGEDRVGSPDYLSAAVGLGIIKDIYWVIPYPFFGSAGGGEQARQFLVDRGLVKDRSEADRFRMAGGCLAGSVRNTEITICAPDTMLFIREPVLLDLDMDFFPVFAQGRGINILEGLKHFMDAIFARRYAVAEASIASPPAGESFDPAQTYIGAQVQEAFKKPSIMQQPDPPPLWKDRDAADALLREGDFKHAYTALKASIKAFGSDEGLRALLACSALELEKHEEALTIAGELCREDKGLCPLLLYLGDRENNRGRPDRAEVFFRQALEVMPAWEPAANRLDASKKKEQAKG